MCRGAEQGGLPGLLRGASRGAAGVLVQPLAFALEASVAVADSLRSAIMGIPPLLPRARPPRHVSPQEPLAVYNWSEVRALLCCLWALHVEACPYARSVQPPACPSKAAAKAWQGQ